MARTWSLSWAVWLKAACCDLAGTLNFSRWGWASSVPAKWALCCLLYNLSRTLGLKCPVCRVGDRRECIPRSKLWRLHADPGTGEKLSELLSLVGEEALVSAATSQRPTHTGPSQFLPSYFYT